MLRGFLTVLVFIVVSIIVGLVAYGKIPLQHASSNVLLGGFLYFIFHLFLLFSFIGYAVKNKNNRSAFAFLIFMVLVELFLLTYLIIHLSTRYIEFVIIFTVLITIGMISILMSKEKLITIKQIKVEGGEILRGFLAIAVFIIAFIVIELVVSGNLELQHTSIETFLKGSLYILLLYSLIILFAELAIKNENNNASLYIFSGIALILSILAVGSAIYLSVKYIEFTILLTFFLVNVFINVLTNMLANKGKPIPN
jgi:hypothetical protein